MPEISIIVPIFNVEKYIEQCLESIIKQTYDNMEIILVDDGSTDSSGYIADRWANADSRVMVIHKKNGGRSSARNAGLEAATSPWIFFLDSDDWLDLDAVEYILNKLSEKDIDIVLFDFYFEYPEFKKQQILELPIMENKIFKLNDIRKNVLPYYVEGNNLNSTCNRIYRRSFLLCKHLKFDETVKRGEDEVFNLYAFKNAEKMLYIKRAIYHYRRTSSVSITNTLSNDYLEYIVDRYNLIKNEVENWELPEHNREQLLKKRLCYNVCQWVFLFFTSTEGSALLKRLSVISGYFNKLQIKHELKDMSLRETNLKNRVLYAMIKHQFFIGLLVYQRLSKIRLKFNQL